MERLVKDVLKSKYGEVLKYASQKHAGQFRIFGEPYIIHPLNVFLTASKFTDDQDVLQAALLHDVVEDTDATAEEIEQKFGSKTASLVKELTSPVGLKHSDCSKANYLSNAVLKMSDEALLLKLCDRLDNLQQIGRFGQTRGDYLRRETRKIINTLTENRTLNQPQKTLVAEIYKQLEK